MFLLSFARRQRALRAVIGIVCVVILAAFVSQAQAVPMITLGNGVQNPPPNVSSTALNPQQTAIADTATLVQVANISNLLQQVLNAQGFTNARNWTLNTNTVTLANNATFNITDYHLFLNPGGNNQGGGLPNGTAAGSAFGENIDFMLNPNLAGPNVPAGSTATLHWLQDINTNAQVNGYGFAINGQQGFWQLDNGQANGAAVSGTNNGAGTNNGNNGPYYDSNNNSMGNPANDFSVPPGFHDGPRYYSGVGTYLHFTAIPTWDIYTPANGPNAATDVIYTADYGLNWGFQIVPEPSSIVLIVIGSGAIGWLALRPRKSLESA